MTKSFRLKLSPKETAAVDFISDVRDELWAVILRERKQRKITQQAIAELIGVHRSVINRELSGHANLTLRRIAELAWAVGYTPTISFEKNEAPLGNFKVLAPTDSQTRVFTEGQNAQPTIQSFTYAA